MSTNELKKKSVHERRDEMMLVARAELDGHVDQPILWSYLFADLILLLPVRLTKNRMAKVVSSMRPQVMKIDAKGGP